MIPFHAVRILATRAAAKGLQLLEVDLRDSPLKGMRWRPGQYLMVRLVAEAHSPFAIASSPTLAGETLDLLIKLGSPLADALAALSPGGTLYISAPLGPGFDLAAAENRNVLMFATGSGISALRPLIEHILGARSLFGEVTLYFGARTADAFAFTHELEKWQTAGIRVVRTVSLPAPNWEGLTGYVQSHLGPDRLDNAVAFVAGQNRMLGEVTQVLIERGLQKDRIFRNH